MRFWKHEYFFNKAAFHSMSNKDMSETVADPEMLKRRRAKYYVSAYCQLSQMRVITRYTRFIKSDLLKKMLRPMTGAAPPPLLESDTGQHVWKSELAIRNCHTWQCATVGDITSALAQMLNSQIRLCRSLHRQRQTTRACLTSVQRELTYIPPP